MSIDSPIGYTDERGRVIHAFPSRRDIRQVWCPTCHAEVGKLCLEFGKPRRHNGVFVSHEARRKAWEVWNGLDRAGVEKGPKAR